MSYLRKEIADMAGYVPSRVEVQAPGPGLALIQPGLPMPRPQQIGR